MLTLYRLYRQGELSKSVNSRGFSSKSSRYMYQQQNKCPNEFAKRPHVHVGSGKWTRPLHALAADERCAVPAADKCIHPQVMPHLHRVVPGTWHVPGHYLRAKVPFRYEIRTHRHPQNRKYITYHNADRRGPSHGRRQHARIGEFWRCGFRVMRASGQTDRQTNILLSHIHISEPTRPY